MFIDLNEEEFQTGLEGQPSLYVPIRLQAAGVDVFHAKGTREGQVWAYDDAVEFAISGLAVLMQAKEYGFAEYRFSERLQYLLFLYREQNVRIRSTAERMRLECPTVQVPYHEAVRAWEAFGERVRALVHKYIPPELLLEYKDGADELAWLEGRPVSMMLEQYGVPRSMTPNDSEYFDHVDAVEHE